MGANLCSQGRDDEAIAVLDKVAGVIEPPINNLASVWVMGCLAVIRTRADDLEAAGRYTRTATDLAAEHGLGEYWLTATAVIAMADVLDGRARQPKPRRLRSGAWSWPGGAGRDWRLRGR